MHVHRKWSSFEWSSDISRHIQHFIFSFSPPIKKACFSSPVSVHRRTKSIPSHSSPVSDSGLESGRSVVYVGEESDSDEDFVSHQPGDTSISVVGEQNDSYFLTVSEIYL